MQRIFAQETGGLSTDVTSLQVNTDRTVADYINMAINLVMGFGVGISVIFLILGGIQYVMSKGDAKAAEAARQWLTNAVIGMIIVVAVFGLRSIVLRLLGFEGIDTSLDTNVVNF